MFVSKARYEKEHKKRIQAEYELEILISKWNKLIKEINIKGGQEFLDEATLNPSVQFSKEEIIKLISLCHPDKHNGKPLATEMTTKLLSIKAKF